MLGRLTRRVLRRRAGPATPPALPAPDLTVVVVARDADTIGGCLESLRTQTVERIEIIVVDDGSSEGASAVAREAGSHDDRIRILARPPVDAPHGTARSRSLDLAAARQAGAREARGARLAFLDASQTVPRTAYAIMLASLKRTGSDFAAGGVEVIEAGKARKPGWAQHTHDLDLTRQTLAGFPAALQDTALTNRIFRTAFWAQVVVPCPEGLADDADVSLLATLSARSFDFLKTVSLIDQAHDPGPPDLRFRRVESAWPLVRKRAAGAAAADWLGRVIDGDLGDLAASAQGADAGYRERLQAMARRCLDAATTDGPAAWSRVRVDRKLRLWLAAQGRWTDLELLIDHFRLFGAIPRTAVRDGRIFARTDDLPGLDGVPQECLELSADQTALTGCVERLHWQGHRLAVRGWALIPGLDLAGTLPDLAAELVETATGETRPCALTVEHRTAANHWSRQRYADAAPGGFRLEVDTHDVLAPMDQKPGAWQLRISLDAKGVRRTGQLDSLAANGAGRQMPARNLGSGEDTGRVVPVLDPALGFGLRVRVERLRARGLAVGSDGTVSGAVGVLDQTIRASSVEVSCAAGRASADLVAGGAREGWFELHLPAGVEADWEVRVIDDRGRRHRLSWPAEEVPSGRTGLNVAWRRTAAGYCALTTAPIVEAERVLVTADGLLVELSADSRLDLSDAGLVGSLATVGVCGSAVSGDRVRLSFPLRARRWGGPELPLPSGDYRLVLGAGRQVGCADALLPRLPDEQRTDIHRVVVGRAPKGELLLKLEPPVADDERGRYAQQQLSEWYAEGNFPETESVLFQCYRGEFATDSQAAIHHELRRRRPDLELLWGVSDLSVAVPEGGRALIIESREWYAALASSRYLCRNIDFERYFRKRPHQRYLQTFHGYPFKSMGASFWRSQGRGESVVAKECARRSRAWDAIVVPEDFCTDLYRREYAYQGPALVTGYPRNDTLVTADAAAVRSRVLNVLGIEEDRIVVLYAPTWREVVATSAWTAKLFDALDLEALSRQLGDRYAVLLRGHNYNLREGLRPGAGTVRDVSSYPEINDLILAADVAVLDYSSLRFDWLITGKPVVFFVPDLDDYLSTRTVLFDYLPTAPGPLLSTTDEVGSALLDLDNVTAQYAAARARCNEAFNRLHDGRSGVRVVDAFF